MGRRKPPATGAEHEMMISRTMEMKDCHRTFIMSCIGVLMFVGTCDATSPMATLALAPVGRCEYGRFCNCDFRVGEPRCDMDNQSIPK